jgi:hypothetical protein
MKLIKLFALMAMVSLMSACGGGGGSPGTASNGGTTSGSSATTTPGATTVSASISDYIFELDKSSIKNSGTDSVVLSVTTLDAARNIVSGVPVSVAVDAGGVFLPGSGAVTDASGKFSGKITAGGDKTDRIINATVTVNGIKKTVTFGVTGSQISVTPVPAVPKPGETVTLNIKVADSANIGIANIPVQLSGSAGFTGNPRTDLAGNLSVTSTAPVAGTYLAVISASGVSTSLPIRVGGTDTSIPRASPTFSGANLLSNPASIPPNLVGSTLNRSVLTAKFIRDDNSTIENMRVRFNIENPSLGANEFISIGDAFAYSNSSGVATADYVSGQRSSPTNGVIIRMCFDYGDFLKTECPNSRISTLTVNSQPLDISIGDFNKLETGLGGIAYVQKFLIQVGDASGTAVPNAVVSMSVDITHFGKGAYGGGYYLTGDIPPTRDGLNYPTTLDPNVNATTITFVSEPPTTQPFITFTETYDPANTPRRVYDPVTGASFVANRVWCVNEDRNRNGFRDGSAGLGGEDLNSNGLLEPSKSEVVLSYVNGNKTDNNGQMLVQVSYPQNMGSWLAFTLKATTSVVGSQGSKERAFLTGVLVGDVPNGSFLTPPFGRNRCIDPN